MSGNRAGSPSFRTIVLSCGELGVRVANALVADGAADVVALIVAPYPVKERNLWAKVRHVLRTQGWLGFAGVLRAKIESRGRKAVHPHRRPFSAGLSPRIMLIEVQDFHSPECLAQIRALRPDLAVIAGTHILKESLFSIPVQGSINIHTGKVPEYRGAAPGFWEIYNGESVIGVTIHRVEAALDAGAVLKQELFALDSAPAGDPMAYIEQIKRDILLPNAIRMAVETVRAIAEGNSKEIPQDRASARTFSSPDYRAVRELRRRVRERRARGKLE